jgi:hypothetical protein
MNEIPFPAIPNTEGMGKDCRSTEILRWMKSRPLFWPIASFEIRFPESMRTLEVQHSFVAEFIESLSERNPALPPAPSRARFNAAAVIPRIFFDETVCMIGLHVSFLNADALGGHHGQNGIMFFDPSMDMTGTFPVLRISQLFAKHLASKQIPFTLGLVQHNSRSPNGRSTVAIRTETINP